MLFCFRFESDRLSADREVLANKRLVGRPPGKVLIVLDDLDILPVKVLLIGSLALEEIHFC